MDYSQISLRMKNKMEHLDNLNLLEKKERLCLLYDLYKELFTAKQQSYFESYFFLDLSLQEIATNANVSRNAVFTALKAIQEDLIDYENKLQLLDKKEKITEIIEDNKKTKEEKLEEIRNIL